MLCFIPMLFLAKAREYRRPLLSLTGASWMRGTFVYANAEWMFAFGNVLRAIGNALRGVK